MAISTPRRRISGSSGRPEGFLEGHLAAVVVAFSMIFLSQSL